MYNPNTDSQGRMTCKNAVERGVGKVHPSAWLSFTPQRQLQTRGAAVGESF